MEDEITHVVTWEQRYTSTNATDKSWHQRIMYCTSERNAHDTYMSVLPGLGGSFGPLEYRRQLIAAITQSYKN